MQTESQKTGKKKRGKKRENRQFFSFPESRKIGHLKNKNCRKNHNFEILEISGKSVKIDSFWRFWTPQMMVITQLLYNY